MVVQNSLGSKRRCCFILPCTSKVDIDLPEYSMVFVAREPIHKTVNTVSVTSGVFMSFCVNRYSAKPVAIQTKVNPNSPMYGASIFNGPSVWVYPKLNHGNPVRTTPRKYSLRAKKLISSNPKLFWLVAKRVVK